MSNNALCIFAFYFCEEGWISGITALYANQNKWFLGCKGKSKALLEATGSQLQVRLQINVPLLEGIVKYSSLPKETILLQRHSVTVLV